MLFAGLGFGALCHQYMSSRNSSMIDTWQSADPDPDLPHTRHAGVIRNVPFAAQMSEPTWREPLGGTYKEETVWITK